MRLLICLTAAALLASAARAQEAPPPATPPAPAQPAPRAPTDPNLIRILIRTPIIALNQANLTGNYTVLRDLGAPGFQAANTAVKLGEVFADLRNRRIDLSPVAVLEPVLSRPAEMQPNGLLHIVGAFPSQPEQVAFEILYQPAGNGWVLFGLGVKLAPAAAAAANPADPKAADPKAAAKADAKGKPAAKPPAKRP